ncbi:MAG: HD domain-containing protein [bacterium]
MISRERALELVHEKLVNKNLRKHVYAVEAVMRALARLEGADEEVWGLTGLLHDLDYEETKDDFPHHTYITREFLEAEGNVSEEMLNAIHAHAGFVPRSAAMEKAIYCGDPVTGFIVACALMHPEKKVASLDADFMLRRFKEKRFAAGADREQMKTCSELGLELVEFLLLARDAMASISSELGL